MSNILCATFDDVPRLKNAVKELRAAGLTQLEVYTPFPVHGIDPLLGYKRSGLGIAPLICGITGFTCGNLLSWWTGAVDYRLINAGMPFYSWVFTFPIAYELTILFAAFGTLIGMFLMNRLPRPHHPIFDHPNWAQYTDDKLLVAVSSADPLFDLKDLEAKMKALGGREVTVIAGE